MYFTEIFTYLYKNIMYRYSENNNRINYVIKQSFL